MHIQSAFINPVQRGGEAGDKPSAEGLRPLQPTAGAALCEGTNVGTVFVSPQKASMRVDAGNSTADESEQDCSCSLCCQFVKIDGLF